MKIRMEYEKLQVLEKMKTMNDKSQAVRPGLTYRLEIMSMRESLTTNHEHS